MFLTEKSTINACPKIAFGMKNGGFGILELDANEAVFLLEQDCPGKSPITLINLAMLKEELHLVLVREDGAIELYHVDGQLREATIVYKVNETETVTGLNVGFITNATRKEILYTCYSGAVKSLVDRKAAKKFGSNAEDAEGLTNAQL